MARTATERNTRQKTAIRDAFERAGRPLSTDEVYAEAERTSRGLGMATVYRAIRTLVDDGWLSVVEMPGCNPLYEIAGKGHHHHFSCTTCGRVYELDGCAPLNVPLPAGFQVADHDLSLHGTCASCNASATSMRRRSV